MLPTPLGRMPSALSEDRNPALGMHLMVARARIAVAHYTAPMGVRVCYSAGRVCVRGVVDHKNGRMG
jgi:hypothetical protein